MKKVLHFAVFLFISINLFAQAPQKMTYQAVIRNASNNLVVNAPVKMKISILQGSISGTALYSELHNPTTNANGLVSIEIGSGTSPVGTIGSINWGNGTYFLKTETDPTNGTNYSIEGTSQLLSVPYALHASNAGNGINKISTTGDTVYLDNGEKYIIPGIKKVRNPPSTINNGLVGYWPFNGNANDESGNGNNGVVNGATLTTDRFGNANNAYSFNGNSNISVQHSNSLNVGNEMTISIWFKQASMGNTINYILQKGTGGGCLTTGYYSAVDYVFGGVPNGMKGLWYGQNNNCAAIASDTSLNFTWHSMIIVYSPSTINRLYINGMLIENKSNFYCNNCTILNSTNPLIIGGFLNAGVISNPKNWNGLLDDIRIYNRTLTQEEITYLANN
jgi:hypothetical protein